MNSIGAAKFKEQCLALLDSLDEEGLLITKHGKPVARLLRFESGESDLIGSLSHKVKVTGDIYSTGLSWDSSAKP